MKQYTVSDGELTLVLADAEEGGFVVTCPADPRVTTQADTLAEAFDMARDALAGLRAIDAEGLRS